jgi:hypothetical protein
MGVRRLSFAPGSRNEVPNSLVISGLPRSGKTGTHEHRTDEVGTAPPVWLKTVFMGPRIDASRLPG